MRSWLNKLGIQYKNLSLYEEAFTHSSWKKENKGTVSYERLEFLGDSVLQLSVSHYLYKLFPEYSEGNLTTLRAKMVQQQTLGAISKKIGVGKLLLLSKSEENQDGRNKERILADAYEALIGAIFLDLGFTDAQAFLNRFFFPLITKKHLEQAQDFKTVLQEKLRQSSSKSLVYKTISSKLNMITKKHHFEVALYFEDTLLAKGEGMSKKQAEQKAAEEALKKMRE